MTTTEQTQKTGPPQIVKFDKALKLAEQWVNCMTKFVEEEPTESELEGRPARLGLGAKVPRKSNFVPSNDPIGRKLHAKLDAEKRKAVKSNEKSDRSVRDGSDVEDDEDDIESRTNAFSKKRPAPPVPFLQGKKKQK